MYVPIRESPHGGPNPRTVGAILACAALGATFIPARRALGLNPAVILKEDT